MQLNLPKPYLSYSALDLWKKNKNAFRKKYYENIPQPDTVYTLFGKEVHEAISKDDRYAAFRLPVDEKKMEVRIDGVPVMGYIDTFDPDTFSFGEYKSGIMKPDGTPRWTQLDVNKHDQLPFYSLLIEEKFGVRVNHTYLLWLVTEMYEEKRKMGGAVLGSERRLRLTGEYHVFNRQMFQYDRKRMRKWIKDSAKEISEDHTLWQKSR